MAGGPYAPTITFGAAGTIASTTLYLRLAANSAAGSYSGNITLNSIGATQQILSISSGTVATKSLTVTGLSGINKIYDGNANATASGAASLSGVVGSDDVALSGTPIFTFGSANVGTAVAVTTSGYTLSGSNAGNYTLTQPSLSANITAKELTISGASVTSRAYNGTTTVAVTGGSLVGVVSPDAVNLGGSPTGTVASATVGEGKAVTVTGYSISGAQAGNYSLTQPTGLTVNITKATPTISTAPTASAITFGQTLADSTLSGGTASVPGTFAFTTPATAPNAGTASQGVTFTPADAANYNSATTSVNVTVNKAAATITLGDLVATFDGEAKAASASTVPQGLNVMLTYDGSAVAPSAVGSYAVVGTIDDANYQGSASGTLVIEKISRPTLADLLADLYSLSGVDAEALADPDSDGFPNLIEYAFGSSPVLPASLPEAARLVIGENATSFSAIVRDDSNLTAIPQFSVDLVTWGVAGITELDTAEVSQDGVPSGFTRRTWKIEGSMPQMYLRWRVKYGD